MPPDTAPPFYADRLAFPYNQFRFIEGEGAPADAPPVAEAPVDVPAGDTGGGAPAPESTGGGGTLGIVLSAEDLDSDLPEGVDTFARSYVDSIRRQAAGYRTKNKPYEEVFGGIDEEARGMLLEFNKLLVDDPDAGARRAIEIARAIAGENFDSYLDPQEPVPLTAEDAQRIYDERAKAEREDSEIKEAEAAVWKEIKELGYEQETPDFAQLLYLSKTKTGGDLAEADKLVKAHRQSIIDEYVKDKAQGNGAFPAVSAVGGGQGPADPEGGPPKTFQSARAAAEARLAAEAGQ